MYIIMYIHTMLDMHTTHTLCTRTSEVTSCLPRIPFLVGRHCARAPTALPASKISGSKRRCCCETLECPPPSQTCKGEDAIMTASAHVNTSGSPYPIK